METIPILKQLGLSDKEVKVYLTLLESGPASVRNLAEKAGINRGTTYDILKSLMDSGLVSYYHKATKQYFIAEDPKKLHSAVDQKLQDLKEVKNKVNQIIPSLKSLYDKAGEKPVVKYYEGHQGIKTIFTDVLETVDRLSEKEYLVFSSSTIKDNLYKAFPNFTKQRINKKIKVKVIAVGHEGTTAEYAEIKSLTKEEGSPTYILIYDNKVAMISLNSKNEPLGIIVEDKALSETQKQLFGFIWENIN
ncbi:ArsR family transcriptional regulator [Patescibacteria group bacterium]|nr:ArsR family transcriptional regulator [Patescibacteria group bacterium]